MSDASQQGAPAPGTAPVVPPAAAAPPAAAPAAAPAVPPGDDASRSAAWLGPRLERERRATEEATLAKLGVKSLDEAAAKIRAAGEAENANKTEAQRQADKLAALELEAAQGRTAAAALKAVADRELAALSETARAVVKANAGDDPARILAAIDLGRAMAGTPATAATTTTTTQAAGAPAAAPAAGAPAAAGAPPANTAPPPNAPLGASGSPPDRKTEYEGLKKTNPTAAAQYLNRYENEIYPRA